MSHFVFLILLPFMFLTSQNQTCIYLIKRYTKIWHWLSIQNNQRIWFAICASLCFAVADICQLFRICQKKMDREILVPKLLAMAIANGGNTNNPSLKQWQINFSWAFPFDHFLWEIQTTCTQPRANLYITKVLFEWQYIYCLLETP